MREQERELDELSREAAELRASPGVRAAAGAPPPPRFTLWHKLPLPAAAAAPSVCPAFPRAQLTAAFANRWPEAGWLYIFNQAYQWHDSHCYTLVFVAPEANSTMEADIAAALAGPGPVDSYCGLFNSSFCGDVQEWYGGAALESVTLNEKVPAYWPGDPRCTKGTFPQKLDHFDASETRTFNQTYYICDERWPSDPEVQRTEGKIMFVQGAEAALGGPPLGALIWESAERQRLLVMSLEHRYYGDSFPFRPMPEAAAVPVEQLQWLTVEQVVEDAAYFLKSMRASLSVPEAVPAITFGGSYGGELAAWLRAAKPDVFAAGISSSGPINFVVGTSQWAKTGNQYHEVVSAAARAGGASCPSTIRAGLDEIERLGKSKAGRAELGERLGLCGGRDAVVSKVSAAVLSDTFYWATFPGYAQYDNQPPRYGIVASACNVAAAAAAASPGDALAPLAALARWDGSLLRADEERDCYVWEEDGSGAALVYDFSSEGSEYFEYNMYTYQCCANGAVFANFMGRQSDADDLYTSAPAAKAALRRDCRSVYGDSVGLRPAPVMADGPKLIRRVGGVVFTNGELDPWSGGSPRSLVDLAPEAKAAAGIEYVTYPDVAHCNDFKYFDPFEPPLKKGLRRTALDAAAGFAEVWRAARL
ncbi:MAG: serine carboxypeptidase S28-domain-containing protein [Monoraphidium minutum]|nr:MAG: serine carboxypeptidase S28-domain-containing protein [Monoraphidium minutum]